MKFHISAGKDFETTTPDEMRGILDRHFSHKFVDDLIREKVRGIKVIHVNRSVSMASGYNVMGLNLTPKPGYVWSLLSAIAVDGTTHINFDILKNGNGLFSGEYVPFNPGKGSVLFTDSDVFDIYADFGADGNATCMAAFLELPAERLGELYV